jgi:hypothetical protein
MFRVSTCNPSKKNLTVISICDPHSLEGITAAARSETAPARHSTFQLEVFEGLHYKKWFA